MRKAFRIVGTLLSIGAVALFLDAIVTATLLPGVINTDRDAAEAGNLRAYVHADYHHDIFPGHDMPRVWGRIIYAWKSDKHGFRTGTCGPGEAEKAWPAIFVIGDSFAEAVGVSYEQSFAGLMACDAARQRKAVWNLGVSSYSPIIYWRKVQAAADKIGRKPSEVYVFLDLSDIDDEANVYRDAPTSIRASGWSGTSRPCGSPTTPTSAPRSPGTGRWAATARAGRSTKNCWRAGAGAVWRSPAATSTRWSASAATGSAG